jgi:chemotaxis response regulator CheB
MPGIREPLVDGPVVIRKILCEALAADHATEVSGTAGVRRIAFGKILQLNPGLIALDAVLIPARA